GGRSGGGGGYDTTYEYDPEAVAQAAIQMTKNGYSRDDVYKMVRAAAAAGIVDDKKNSGGGGTRSYAMYR
ncbi:MAG: hypothetical protein J6P20_02995, partial [Oscillospiraceae bacterium]|nr:hypothetical protein [Oscillospiraceae bacterium]